MRHTPPLGEILKEMVLSTANQYFWEELHMALITGDFSEVKRTTLTYRSSKSGTH